MMQMRAVLACCLLAGCANYYDPPVRGDHSTEKYQADLKKCHAQVNPPANRKANATVGSTIRSMFKSDDPQRDATRTCMLSKGYVLE